MVVRLRQQGWSLRRIAERLGVSLGTVAGDTEVFKNEHLTLPSVTVVPTRLGGREY